MSINIKLAVTPDKLDRQALIVEEYIDSIKNDFERIQKIVEGSKTYWAGNASMKHQEVFEENEADLDIILKRLKEHPNDLRKMAGIYREVEETNKTMAVALSDNVIF